MLAIPVKGQQVHAQFWINAIEVQLSMAKIQSLKLSLNFVRLYSG